MTAAWSSGGALIGLVGGTGLLLVLAGVPPGRRPDLVARLAPYVRDAVPRSALLGTPTSGNGVLAAVERFFGPLLGDAAGRLERAVGGGASVRRRLERLGRGGTVEQFRSEQVVWGVLGAVAGTLLGGLIVVGRGGSAVPALGLVLRRRPSLGVLLRDRMLSSAVQRREERMLAELPTVADLLALAVAAGEGVAGGAGAGRPDLLRRAGRRARPGPRRRPDRRPADRGAGPLAARTGLPPLARFAEGS